MQKKKEVLVCCAAYNHAKYIRQSLEGFFMQQTNFDYEVYVHDDASTDGTQEVLREYQKKYPDQLIVEYEVENQQSKGRHPFKNVFSLMSEYKYIAICEGDDYWIYPYKLQKQYDLLENDMTVMMCVHNGIEKDNNKRFERIAVNYIREGFISPNLYICRDNGQIPTSSFFCRPECYTKRPKYMMDAPVDDDTIVWNAGIHGKIYYFDDAWTVYNYQSGNDSWTTRVEKDGEYLNKYTKEYVKFLDAFELDTKARFRKQIRTWRLMILHNTIQILLRSAGNTVRELCTLIESYKDLFNHKYDFEFDVSFKCSLVHCVDFKEYLCSFKHRNSEKKLFIYGAGEIARQTLFELGRDYSGIEGCVVSSEPLTAKFGGVNVSNINEVISREDNPIFILALGLKNTYQVMEHLNELGVSDSIL